MSQPRAESSRPRAETTRAAAARAAGGDTFVVTVVADGGGALSRVWHAERPLPLGHPFRWVLERTARGVRVRAIDFRPGEVVAAAWREIQESELHADRASDLSIPGLRLSVRPVAHARELLLSESACAPDRALSILSYATSAGDAAAWVLASHRLAAGGACTLAELSHPAASLRHTAPGLVIEARRALHWARAEDAAPTALAARESITVPWDDVHRISLLGESRRWRFASAAESAALVERADATRDPEGPAFRRACQASAAALGLLGLLTWFWPATPPPEQQELIPAQFAKILLQPREKSAPAPASASAVAANAPKRVQNTEVVRAFRAQALRSSMNSLLKGGMTRLLAQSDFVAGAKASADSKSVFRAAAQGAQPLAPEIGTGRYALKVGGVGSEGVAGAKVGYGKGQKAGVAGQGKSLVSMDIGGADVEEGLTKDQVGEVIHKHLAEVRYCYESAMVRMPDLEGKLNVAFTIGGNGAVKLTEVKNSSLPDPRLDDCILRRLATWKFPNPKGGIDVAVTYPFIFKTLGR